MKGVKRGRVSVYFVNPMNCRVLGWYGSEEGRPTYHINGGEIICIFVLVTLESLVNLLYYTAAFANALSQTLWVKSQMS
jgi:hypothetical protein